MGGGGGARRHTMYCAMQIQKSVKRPMLRTLHTVNKALSVDCDISLKLRAVNLKFVLSQAYTVAACTSMCSKGLKTWSVIWTVLSTVTA